MAKRVLLFTLCVFLVFLVSCTTNNTSPTTVINNNYLVAEFQQGVLPYAGYDGCVDTNIANGSPYYNYNYGASAEGSMGYLSGGPYITRYMVKFDVASIPSGVIVKKTYLTLYGNMVGGAGTISAHKKTEDWSEGSNSGTAGTPSWNSTSGGGGFSATPAGTVTIDGAKYYSFEIDTVVVQEWINNSSVNYGLLVKGDNEAVDSWLWCFFSEASAPSMRPKLTVYYTVN